MRSNKLKFGLFQVQAVRESKRAVEKIRDGSLAIVAEPLWKQEPALACILTRVQYLSYSGPLSRPSDRNLNGASD